MNWQAIIFAVPMVLAFGAAAWVYLATSRDEAGSAPAWARGLPVSLLLGLGLLFAVLTYGMATVEWH
jgi:uncharacterized membrane protein